MWAKTAPSLLTVFALVGLGAMVYFIMRFSTSKSVGLPPPYWLVPIFGAVGGAIGGLLRPDDQGREGKTLALCRIEPGGGGVRLGVVGDLCTGMGGSAAAAFLFGNVLLRVAPNAASSSAPNTVPNLSSSDVVLLISVSFLAGVFAKDVVLMAGRQLLRQAKETAKEVADESAGKATAVTWSLAARGLINDSDRDSPPPNVQNLKQALEDVKTGLKLDSKNLTLYVEKGRALKRLGNLPEALEAVEAGLRVDPDDWKLLYNRACYLSLSKVKQAEILADLRKAVQKYDRVKEMAQNDPDLDWARNNDQAVKQVIES